VARSGILVFCFFIGTLTPNGRLQYHGTLSTYGFLKPGGTLKTAGLLADFG
jgi:hypothetical protein